MYFSERLYIQKGSQHKPEIRKKPKRPKDGSTLGLVKTDINNANILQRTPKVTHNPLDNETCPHRVIMGLCPPSFRTPILKPKRC